MVSGLAVCFSPADCDADCRQALFEMFGVDKAEGPCTCSTQASWSGTRRRPAVTLTRRWRAQRGHTASSSNFLMVLGENVSMLSPVVTADAIPQKETLPQDGLLQAESLAQSVSLGTEASHLRNNAEGISHHVAMFFDGSTLRPTAGQLRGHPRESS